MVPSITYLDRPGRSHRAGRLHRIGRAGRVGRALHAPADRPRSASIALDTSSRTSAIADADSVRAAVRHRAGVRAARRRISTRCSTSPMPRCSSAIRRCSSITRADGVDEDRSRRRVDGDDGPAVRLGVLGRPADARRRRRRRRCCSRRPSAAWRTPDAIARRLLRRRPGPHRRSAQAYLRDNLMFRLTDRALEGLRTLLSRGDRARAASARTATLEFFAEVRRIDDSSRTSMHARRLQLLGARSDARRRRGR